MSLRLYYLALCAKKKSHAVLKAVLAFLCLFFASFEFLFAFEADGKVYAENLINYENDATVDNPSNALADNGDFSRLYASPGAVLGLGAYEGVIEIGFDGELPANTTSYIKIDADENLLHALLGGSLGEVLSGVLGAVLLGNQIIEVSAINSSNDMVYSRNSDEGFSTNRARLVQDDDGDFYLMITPDEAYSSLRVLNTSSSLAGLGSEYTLDIYHAFYYSENLCNYTPEFISYDGNGINLDALSLGSGGVQFPENAIDNDISTSASISPGLLNVGGSISQFFYFSNLSNEEDEMMITLSGDPSVLNLELLSDITFVAYDGDNEVYEQNLGALSDELLGLIKLDILGLLESGEQVTFPVIPGVSFDRFEIKVGSLVDVDVFEAINIHEVERTIGMPSFDASASGNEYSVCKGESLSISPSSYSGSSLKWYNENGDFLDDQESLNLNSVISDQTYYVSSSDNCGEAEVESARVPVTVEALEVPDVEDFQAEPLQAEYGEGETVVLEPYLALNTEIEEPQFVWSFNENGIPAISQIEIDKGDHSVSYIVRPDGTMEITGLLADEEIDDVYLVLSNGEHGCKTSELVDQVFRILPLAWQYFEGEGVSSGIKLKWSAGINEKLVKFIVQRADKDLRWNTIGEVLDDLSLGAVGTYDFLDFKPIGGFNYYRVQAVYADGKKEFSKTILVEYSGSSPNGFSISPNPVYDRPKLQNNTGESYKNVTVVAFNSNGREVYKTHINSLEAWSQVVLEDSPILRSGVYMYCIYAHDSVEKVKVIW